MKIRRTVRSHRFNLLHVLVVGLTLCLVALVGCFETADRDEAMGILARWEDRRLADPDSLSAMIQDPDAHVRRAAVRCAGLIGRTDVLPSVLDALDDTSDSVRAEACLALGFLGDESAVTPLSAAVAGDQTRVRRAALFALARIPNDGSALWDVALHGEPHDAAMAWDALRDRTADLDSTQLAETIRAGLVRHEIDVLWRVLRCAERSGTKDLLPEIAPFTEHSNASVRVHACRAVALLGGDEPFAIDAVLSALADLGRYRRQDADRVQIQALRALGALAGPRLGDPDDEHTTLIAALTEGARSANPHVARTALESMAVAVADLPLPPQATARESLLPVWRIRLLQSARAQLMTLDEHLAPDPGDQPEPVVRAAAIRAVCALRGEGVLAEDSWTRIVHDQHPLCRSSASEAAASFVLPVDRFLSWIQTLDPELPSRLLLSATSAMMAARDRYNREEQTLAVRTLVDQRIEDRLRSVVTESSWAPVAQAAAQLGHFPSNDNLGILIQAWDDARGWQGDDVRLGVLDAFERFFADNPAAWTPPDSLADGVRRILSAGFDAGDGRQRLRAREIAVASSFLPDEAIPTAGSLRATVPPVIRHPDQGNVAQAFTAPRVRCTTERGEFIITLDGAAAPNTCATFLALIRGGGFEDLNFHRVVPDFVIQGGDPDGTGWGGPGYSIRSEWSDTPFERGTVGIAHSGKDTGGSQFFVCHSAQPHLNGRYTVFGKVEKGMDIVDLVQPDDSFRLEIIVND